MKKRYCFLVLFLSMTVAYAGSGGNGGEGGGSLFGFGGKGGKGGHGQDAGGAGGKGGPGLLKNGKDGENGKCTKAGLEHIQTESQNPEQNSSSKNECSGKETENGEDEE